MSPPQLLAVKSPVPSAPAPQVPNTLSAAMSPAHPLPSVLGVHPIEEPSGSRYIRSRATLPSATNRLPCESTATPVGSLRLVVLGVLGQSFEAKPPPQLPNTRFAVWLVSGELYSNTASGSPLAM